MRRLKQSILETVDSLCRDLKLHQWVSAEKECCLVLVEFWCLAILSEWPRVLESMQWMEWWFYFKSFNSDYQLCESTLDQLCSCPFCNEETKHLCNTIGWTKVLYRLSMILGFLFTFVLLIIHNILLALLLVVTRCQNSQLLQLQDLFHCLWLTVYYPPLHIYNEDSLNQSA